MKISFLLSCVLLMASTLYGQTISLREVCSLPASLAETSGLETTGPNHFWTHNDSGGQAAVYAFDTLGNITRTIALTNAGKTDWEDITKDAAGNIYVGDFGNNGNDRKNLYIYKIPPPASIPGNSVAAATIQFKYPDQKAYPPADNQKNFDMEAMIFFNDSLYLFSKNQTTPFNGYTKLYRLPAAAGTYTAALVDSFYTGTDMLSGQITAAALSPDKQRLALLTYTKIYVFSEFSGSRFFSGKISRLDMSSLSQKEGIAFMDNCTVYVTDEEFMGTGRKLYKANICITTTGLNHAAPDPSLHIQKIYPNPALAEVAIHYQLPYASSTAQLLIYNLYGQEISRNPLQPSAASMVLPVSGWPAGIYFCRIETGLHFGYTYKLAIAK